MIERELLDSAPIPGGGELRLFCRRMKQDAEYSIALGSNELMNSRLSSSEEALATLSCSRVKTPQPSILVGGYGMGFTLRAALKVLPENACIEVVELVPKIVEWAQNQMSDLTAGCLDDPRVKITRGDVANVIAESSDEFDAILLDVDNGPDGLTSQENGQLYGMAGLSKAKKALRQNGILAIWSSDKDEKFTRRLNQSKFSVEQETVTARPGGKGAKHNIWLAMNY